MTSPRRPQAAGPLHEVHAASKCSTVHSGELSGCIALLQQAFCTA